MIIFPAIDLRGGKCVRLYQGDYAQQTVYGEDPVAMARHWVELGAEFLHVVDLDGARAGKPAQAELVRAIAAAARVPVQVGGGIRERETVAEYLKGGIERVIIGTRGLENPAWLAAMCAEFPGRIVCGVDARDGHIRLRGWEEDSGADVLELVRTRLNGMGLRALVFTDIGADGTLAGPNLERTRALCEISDAPVIASGGVGTIDHVRAVAALPVEGLIVGRALYAGTVELADALRVAREGAAAGARTPTVPSEISNQKSAMT